MAVSSEMHEAGTKVKCKKKVIDMLIVSDPSSPGLQCITYLKLSTCFLFYFNNEGTHFTGFEYLLVKFPC